MMCNYGSSEYAQAFSRIGSLFGNVYIVNEDLELQDAKFAKGESGRQRIESVEINYNDSPISFEPGRGGIIAGHHFSELIGAKFGLEPRPDFKQSLLQCLRVTVLTRRPLLRHTDQFMKLATFVIPPQSKESGTFVGNACPIRVYQLNHFIDASPPGFFLLMLSMQLEGERDLDEQRACLYRLLSILNFKGEERDLA
mmetsp:Transcript_17365/g.29202  ORF Transcript_17365/g.29202 Transcript_17365/m.29202 type:complete len:197 (+) Transcript_17365:229-819(+)